MDESKKKQWQLEAETIAFFHLGIQPSYELFVGLTLNLWRIKKQWSIVYADSLRIAYPGEEIPLEFFEAISETKVQAKKMYQQTNQELQVQKAQGEVRRG